MNEDEKAIRELIENWLLASQAGDLHKLASLMADDVVFMVPGREPFGKQAFAASAEQLKNSNMEAFSEIFELQVMGDQAWCRSHINVTMTPPSGKAQHRSGYTLTIFKKNPAGAWVLYRDANLMLG